MSATLAESGLLIAAALGWVGLATALLGGWQARRRARRDAAAAEERFRVLAAGSLQGVLVHDAERWLFVNDAYARMMGYADAAAGLAEGYPGRHILPEDRPLLGALWQKIIGGHTGWARQRRRRVRIDGSLLWVDMMVGPVTWNGRPALQVVQVDVTREVEAEAELQGSEARFRSFAADSLQGILVHDGATCLFANDAFARMMGFADTERLIGRDLVSEMVPDDVLPAMRAEWRELLDGRRTWSRQRELRRRQDGTGIWVDNIRGPVTWGGRPAIQVVQIDVSREVAAEAELRDSEARFRTVVDNLPLVLTVKDADRRLVLVNREFERWYGIGAGEAVGHRPEQLVAQAPMPIIGPRAPEDDLGVMRTGEPVYRERSVTVADGSSRDVIVTKFPLRDPAGAVTGVGTILSDVTALKQAQAELARREAAIERHQATLVRIVRDGLLTGVRTAETLDGIVRTACRTLGIRRVGFWTWRENDVNAERCCVTEWDETLRRHIRPDEMERVLPEDLKRWFTPDYMEQLRHDFVVAIDDAASDPRLTPVGRARAVARGIGGRLNALVRLPERVYGVVIFLAGPEPHAWSAADQAFARSVADLIAFVLLSDRHRQALAALDLVNQGIYVEDARGDVIYANRVARMLAGQPDGSPVTLARLPAAPADGEAAEMPWRSPGGEPLELAVARNALPGRGAVTVIADVTERRQRERERLALEAEMRQSAKLEAVGRLAGGVAHDFNNLIGTIMGFAGFLLEDLPVDSAQHDYAARIARASEHAKAVVKQLLAFTRATDVERSVADLRGLVEESSDLLRASLPSSTSFVIDAGETALPALVNVSQVHQILLNLCLNANDALGGETGTVALSLSRLAAGEAELSALHRADPEAGRSVVIGGQLRPDRAHARLTVSDTGAGMDGATLSRVFEPFFTTKTSGHGTGLGLAVVHGIVTAYGGAYAVESQPGRGSWFSVYLPLADGAPPPVERRRQPRAPEGRERVLLVDDEHDLLEMMRTGLARLGYSVTVCNDPLQALEDFRADPQRWDVVVTDHVMPGMKGTTLIGQIKAVRPDCPVILCTGFSDGSTEREARAAGAGGFFLKPVEPALVAARIRTLRDGRRAAPTLRPAPHDPDMLH